MRRFNLPRFENSPRIIQYTTQDKYGKINKTYKNLYGLFKFSYFCQGTISTQKLKLLGEVPGYDLYYSLTHPLK